MAKNAIDVAIGGKADMGLCAAWSAPLMVDSFMLRF
jgi:hypothetical protein